MNKRQLKLLKYVYKSPKPTSKIYKKFNVDSDSFKEHIFTQEMVKYCDTVDVQGEWDFYVEIKPLGKEIVEKSRRNKARYLITTGIAIAGVLATVLSCFLIFKH
jgi:hypothetical protein